MYAVIQTGGKQYTVKPGDVLHIEKLDKDLGAEFDISEVVMLGGESNLVWSTPDQKCKSHRGCDKTIKGS